MLVAMKSGQRIEADHAIRGEEYRCPGCNAPVIAKKGRKVVHHFAHKQKQRECDWDAGETHAHRQAKKVIRDSATARGLRAELEYTINTQLGSQRADVMVWATAQTLVAFELQHTALDLDELEKRACGYAHSGTPQIWIPFLRPLVWDRAKKREDGSLLVSEYPARPFEKWIHGLHQKRGMWTYDPASETLWHALLADHYRWVDGSTWYEDGEEQYREPFQKKSARWKELTLRGPFLPATLQVSLFTRGAYSVPGYTWPSCRVAQFVSKGT